MPINFENKQTVSNFQSVLILLLLIGFVVIVRMRLLDIPLERDEGEYAYIAQLLLKGYAPFSKAYNMKYPGTSFVMAPFIALIGNKATSIHLCLLVANLLTIGYFYYLTNQLLGKMEALIASAVFGFMSLSQYYLGFAAHATHFVLLFVIPGFYYLLKGIEKKSNLILSISGLLFGFSFLMKQSAVFFLIFGFGIIIWNIYDKKINWKNILFFSLAMALPLIILITIVSITSNFDKFWFWTYTYLSEYGTKVSGSKGKDYLFTQISSQFDSFPILLILSVIGLIFLQTGNFSKYNKILLTSFVVASFLTVVPGLYFRSHYFITSIPALSLLIASLYQQSKFHKSKGQYLSTICLIFIFIGLGQLIYNQNSYFFKDSPEVISRKIYGVNPFIESAKISNYIEHNTNKEDKIAILGSEPQIYYYSNRVSSTGYIYTYNLMEPHEYALKMQEEMISEIEKDKPKIIVYVTVPTSWKFAAESKTKIFNWLRPYLYENYDQTGLVEYKTSGEVSFAWDSKVAEYGPVGKTAVLIYKRKEI